MTESSDIELRLPGARLAFKLNSMLVTLYVINDVSVDPGVVVAESEYRMSSLELPTPMLVRKYIGIVAAVDLLKQGHHRVSFGVNVKWGPIFTIFI